MSMIILYSTKGQKGMRYSDVCCFAQLQLAEDPWQPLSCFSSALDADMGLLNEMLLESPKAKTKVWCRGNLNTEQPDLPCAPVWICKINMGRPEKLATIPLRTFGCRILSLVPFKGQLANHNRVPKWLQRCNWGTISQMLGLTFWIVTFYIHI